MFIECRGCSARLTYNHKQHKAMRELSCPHCGDGFRKCETSRRSDPFARHEMLVWRFQAAVAQFEEALAMARRVAPTLGELAGLLREIRLPHLAAWQLDADAGDSVTS